jgi:DNA polymerase elongation subunit (family B)
MVMLKIFVDIETLPPEEDMRRHLSPTVVRKLLRKKAQNGICDAQECTEEEFRELALHGEFGRVLTIGVLVEHNGEVTCHGVFGRERQTMMFHLDEARTLRGFWNLLKGFNVNRDLIIGHNIHAFDLPFLEKRSRIHRIRPTVKFSYAKFRSQPIYDTMQEWCLWNFGQFISLDLLAEVLKLGINKTKGMNGGRVYECFCEGRHEDIASYCLRDVEVVRAVYYALEYQEGPVPELPPA